MTDFTITETKRRPYLYVERTTSLDPNEIGQAMGDCLGQVGAFMAANKIKPTGPAMAVYPHFDAHSMTFRAGFPVSAAKAKLAGDGVAADAVPKTRAISFRHVGPYDGLRAAYAEMMGHMQLNGLHLGSPTWEIYEVGPDDATPDRYETVVYAALA